MSPFQKISKIVRLLVVILAVALSSHAQEQDGFVKAEILTLSLSGVVSDLHYLSKEGLARTTVYSRGFGIPIEYEGPQEMIFFRPTANPEGFSGGDRKIVSRVTLPSGVSRVLLLFEKIEGADDEAYRIIPINNDPGKMPAGAYRILNLSTVPFVGKIGGSRINLAQGKTTIVSDGGDENGNFEVRFFSTEKGKEGVVYSSVWQTKKTRRTTVFLLASTSDRQDLEVRKFIEPFVEKKKKK
ncbi:MAG: hypothetical protein P1U86_06975 [Verrucomicrobiales bacterium]|nr:hypothetical protein [Verrucomicrobiales bacterium]